MQNFLFYFYKKLANFLIGYRFGEIPLLKTIYTILLSRLRPDYVLIDGQRFYLDQCDSMGLSIHEENYEGLEIETFKKNLRPGDNVLDIGAFIGYYSMIASKIVGNKGRVFAFEPSPSNFNLLVKNIQANRAKNVTLVNKAVSNKNGKSNLFLSEYNHGDNRIFDSNDGRNFVPIETIKLDDYFKNFQKKIDFVKLDVQGSEMAVLKGMVALMKKNKNLKIISEFWPYGMKKFGVKPEEPLNLLKSLGFKIYNLNEDKNILEEKTINQIIKLCPRERATNIYCLR